MTINYRTGIYKIEWWLAWTKKKRLIQIQMNNQTDDIRKLSPTLTKHSTCLTSDGFKTDLKWCKQQR